MMEVSSWQDRSGGHAVNESSGEVCIRTGCPRFLELSS